MKRLLPILVLLMFASCGIMKPKYIPQIQHDTTVVYKNNNVYQHDSIYVYKDRNVYTKGDTVFVNQVEYKDRWKIKKVHDTTYVDKVKTETKVEYVEKNLTKRQEMLQGLGYAFFVLVIGLLIYSGYKLYKRFKI